MVVGSPQCLDVLRAGHPSVDKICPSPREGRLPKLAGEKIADKARKAPVPIGKGMNFNKAMAEPNGDFVRRIRSVFNPVPRIVDGLLHVRRDPVPIDTDIAGSLPVLPRPTPYIAEHPTV